jgi:hypothetical protein
MNCCAGNACCLPAIEHRTEGLGEPIELVARSLAAAVNMAFFVTSRLNWSFPHGENSASSLGPCENGLLGGQCSLQIEIAIPVHEKDFHDGNRSRTTKPCGGGFRSSGRCSPENFAVDSRRQHRGGISMRRR